MDPSIIVTARVACCPLASPLPTTGRILLPQFSLRQAGRRVASPTVHCIGAARQALAQRVLERQERSQAVLTFSPALSRCQQAFKTYSHLAPVRPWILSRQ